MSGYVAANGDKNIKRYRKREEKTLQEETIKEKNDFNKTVYGQ